MANKLTHSAALAIRPGEILRDEKVRGLELHGKAEAKGWFFYYRTKTGDRRRPKLGEFPALGIEDAREAARALATEVAKGEDPSAKWRWAREAPTMAELFDRWLELHAEPNKKPRSIEEDRRNWSRHLAPRIGNIKAHALTLAEVQSALTAIGRVKWENVPLTRPTKTGPQTRAVKVGGAIAANRCRALVSGILTFAERSDVAVRPRGSNFIPETKLNRERKRKRHVTRAEFPRIWRALEDLAEEYRLEIAAIWATLYSGSRVSELLACRYAWLDGSVIRRPDHKTESATGEDRIIRLPRQALELVSAARSSGNKSPMIFGNTDRWDVGRVWAIVRERAGCRDVQPRDLRRTFASVAATSGLSLDDVANLLGHAGDERVTAGYAYVFDDDKAAMVQRIADAMDKMAGGDT